MPGTNIIILCVFIKVYNFWNAIYWYPGYSHWHLPVMIACRGRFSLYDYAMAEIATLPVNINEIQISAHPCACVAQTDHFFKTACIGCDSVYL